MAKPVPGLTFDTARTPPSAEAIAEQIRLHEADLVDLEKREKVVKRKIASPSGLLCLAVLASWAAGLIPWEWAGPLVAASAAIAWTAATRMATLSWVAIVAGVTGAAGASTARALYGDAWILQSFFVTGFLGAVAAGYLLATVERIFILHATTASKPNRRWNC